MGCGNTETRDVQRMPEVKDIIDGNNQSMLFTICANNITINDLILINGNSRDCGAIYI